MASSTTHQASQNASSFHKFAHGHQDLLLAISYNYYGTHMATASSDHRVRVWERDDAHLTSGTLTPGGASGANGWHVLDSWVAHDGEVTDIAWAGPYVGEHLGTIGEDGYVRVWQEDVGEPAQSGRRFKKIFQQMTTTGAPYAALAFRSGGAGGGGSGGSGGGGLETQLAVTTRDGRLTVWEPEEADDLSAWRILYADWLGKTPARTEETSFRVSWHGERLPPWPAVLAGLDRRTLSLAVSVGNLVRVFRTDKDRKFYVAATLEGATALVRDVAWANGSMRGFDMLATASKDGFIRIYELHTPTTATTASMVGGTTPIVTTVAASSAAAAAIATPPNGSSATASPMTRPTRSGIRSQLDGGRDGKRDENARGPGAVRQDAKLVAELEAHNGAPWRVAWSPMGDVLVSTGDDGTSRMWRKSTEGKWIEAAEIDAIGS